MDKLISRDALPRPLAGDTVETIRNSGAGFLADLIKMAALEGQSVNLTGMDARDSGAGFVQDMLKAHDEEDLVPPPVGPVLVSLSPASLQVGTGPTSISVIGTGFTVDSNILSDGVDIASSFVSDTEITVSVDATAETVRTIQVVVEDGDGGVRSNALPFNFTAPPLPPPTLTAIDPTSGNAGTTPFDLAVTGTGFAADAVGLFDAIVIPATVNSDTSITLHVDPTGMQAMYAYAVGIRNGDGQASNTASFTLVN
jgi:IPT/TIG domain